MDGLNETSQDPRPKSFLYNKLPLSFGAGIFRARLWRWIRLRSIFLGLGVCPALIGARRGVVRFLDEKVCETFRGWIEFRLIYGACPFLFPVESS